MVNDKVAHLIQLFVIFQSWWCNDKNYTVVWSFVIGRHRNPHSKSHSLQTMQYQKQRMLLQCNGNKEHEDSLVTDVASNPNFSPQQLSSSKTDLYTSDELMNLLNIHTSLSESIPDFASPTKEALDLDGSTSNISLHDMIRQTVQSISNEQQPIQNSTEALSEKTTEQPWTTLKFQSSLTKRDFIDKIPKLRAIASDVDGTLLGSDHSLHPITEQAIIHAVEASYSPIHPIQYFFPATGKTRTGALNSLGPKMKSLLQQSPGVYVQGLYCVDGMGKVIFEKKLSQIAVEQVEMLVTAEPTDITLVAYDGDNLYINDMLSHERHVIDVSMKWGEPCPLRMTDSYSTYENSFHKVLLMGDDPNIITTVIRPKLEELAVSLGCVVTQAIPTMLELLPGGCSKALGVQKLCESLGIDVATEVCAIGDAENDYDMIRTASIGIAVGNAVISVQTVADIVMDDTSTDGAAGQAIELFGLGKVIDVI